MNLENALRGYRMVLAEILYYMPDHPSILQSFIWQYEDLTPNFPNLNKFLTFWDTEIDAPIHKVHICSKGLLPQLK